MTFTGEQLQREHAEVRARCDVRDGVERGYLSIEGDKATARYVFSKRPVL